MRASKQRQDAQSVDKQEKLHLKTNLYDTFRKAALMILRGKYYQCMRDELYEEVFSAIQDLKTLYQEALEAADFQKRLVRFCVTTDRSGFRIPFEWMKTSPDGSPLCLEHPVRRFLTGYADFRPEIQTVDKKDLRVLLISADTGKIADVDNEVDDLEKFFAEVVRLPKQNICKLDTSQATLGRIEKEITGGSYHLLHFAGHGGRDEQRGSYIQVFETLAKDNVAYINAPMLNEWIKNSNLRFVYMSNCLNANMVGMSEISSSKLKFRPTQDILQAIVEAKVPEVISFHWPIEDNDSRQLANAFYEHYITNFDAAAALLEARKKFADQDAQIWAAPILVQQI
jgi:hypothetical protein